jgi:antitoxin VapB
MERAFAKLESVSFTEAIAIAMREALARRLANETPMETAARLRGGHGITLTEAARRLRLGVPQAQHP